MSTEQAVVGGLALADEARDFGAFYRDEWRHVAGFCAALVRDATLGDELAQETFVRLYLRWRLVRDPRAYAFRIAANLAKAHVRRLMREQPHAEVMGGSTPASDTELADAVSRLPARLQRVVWLRYYADLPISTIATALRRPVGTVKRQLYDAHKLLADALGDHDA